MSKVFERCIFRQLSNFMDQFLSKYQCGFHKGYSTQYCLLAILEKCKSAVDKGKSFGALLTDLSKGFYCLSHELLLAKLHVYGISIAALRLIHSYLTNRGHRTKINMSCSSWEEIVFGVPQASILGSLLFNIFLCDLFFLMRETDFSSYADDNTPYRTADTIKEVIKLLERDSAMLFKWFSDSQMKANISKCHLLVNKKDEVVISSGETKIENSDYEKLLGIKVDTKLNFNEHLNDIISKASRKVNALSRAVPYMSLSKKKILMNSFFTSQFSYCPLIWMFHSRIMNNEINRLHERSMRLIYGDKTLSFEKLLEQDKCRLRDICYNLRGNSNFAVSNVKSVFHGSENISYLGPKIWDIVPLELKQLTNLNAFKKGIKNWQPKNCPCRLCKQYILNLGFISNTSETCF